MFWDTAILASVLVVIVFAVTKERERRMATRAFIIGFTVVMVVLHIW